jgi:ATP-binding cassette subfamily B protein
MRSISPNDIQIYRTLLRLARPYWLHIVAMFVLSLLATPLSLLSPLPLKIAVDSYLNGQPVPRWFAPILAVVSTPPGVSLLVGVAALVMAIALAGQLQGIAYSYVSTYVGQRLVLRFRTLLFRHIQRLSLTYHDSRGSADSTYRIQYDATSIDAIATDGVFPFLTALITLITMIGVTMRIDWQLAAVGLTITPLLLVSSNYCRRRMRGSWRDLKQSDSSALSVLQEALGAIRVVKAFGQETREEGRFVDRSQQSITARLRVTYEQARYGFAVGMITSTGTAAVMLVGLKHVHAGALSLGNLLLVMAYLTRLYEPLRVIGKRAADLQSQLVSAERALSVLEQPNDVTERRGARPLLRATGRLSFRNITFGYEKDHLVLRDISFDVKAGARVGIAGRTGAGKTTMLSLLTRFYDPWDGQILLDDADLRDIKLEDLRNQFAIVLQEPVLFSTTIAENIAYARPDADRAAIVAAAKAANAHEFILGLPDGYETLVGERGMRLSGGERQRISLARAFLKDAPILLLDEPTSSVDVKTEQAIMDAMDRLMEGRTSVLIAHRLTTLEKCDQRLEIVHGRIVSDSVAAPEAGFGAGVS